MNYSLLKTTIREISIRNKQNKNKNNLFVFSFVLVFNLSIDPLSGLITL